MTPHPFRLAVIKLLFAFLALASSNLQAGEVTAIWQGEVGNWNDGPRWSTKPYFPNNNGGQFYSAVIDNGDVTLNQHITIEQFMLGAAGTPTLRTNFNSARSKNTRNVTLSVRSNLDLNQGLITGNGTIKALGATTISGDSSLYGWSVTLSGHTMWSGRLGVGNASVIDNLAGATLDLSPGAICTYYWPNSQDPNGGKRTLNNYGTINARGGGVAVLDLPLNNLGTINAEGGSLVLTCGGTYSGPINLANGATLNFSSSNIPTGPGYAFTESSSISGIGSVTFNSWNFVIHGNYDITGTTTVGGTVSFPSPIASLGSSLVVNGQFANCDLGSNSATVGSLNLIAGTITGSGIVTVDGPLEWKAGSMLGGGTTIAQNGVFFSNLTGAMGFDFLDRTLNCHGSSSVHTTLAYKGNLNFGLNAALNIMPGATFNGSRLMISGSSTGQTNGTVTNYGTLVIDNPGLNRGMSVSGTAFVNQGNIEVTNSTLDVRSGANSSAYIQNAGSVQLNNATFNINTTSTINGGGLSGNGSIGDIVSNGLIAPSGGSLNFFQSTLALQSNSVLAYHLSGTLPGVSFGYLNNVSTAALGGALEIELSEAFQSQVQSSDIFNVLSAQSITGQFTNVASGGRLSTADGSGSFVVTYNGNQLVLSNFLAN